MQFKTSVRSSRRHGWTRMLIHQDQTGKSAIFWLGMIIFEHVDLGRWLYNLYILCWCHRECGICVRVISLLRRRVKGVYIDNILEPAQRQICCRIHFFFEVSKVVGICKYYQQLNKILKIFYNTPRQLYLSLSY